MRFPGVKRGGRRQPKEDFRWVGFAYKLTWKHSFPDADSHGLLMDSGSIVQWRKCTDSPLLFCTQIVQKNGKKGKKERREWDEKEGFFFFAPFSKILALNDLFWFSFLSFSLSVVVSLVFLPKPFKECLFLVVLPLHVSITSPKTSLSAEKVYDVHCLTYGSRPSALVSWWLGNNQLLDHSTQVNRPFFQIIMQ